jgi:hypothetical protein
MDFEELFENIDYDSPLTDTELDYIDLIGKPLSFFMKDEKLQGFSSGRAFVEFVKKELDTFETPDVELVDINDYEISGS